MEKKSRTNNQSLNSFDFEDISIRSILNDVFKRIVLIILAAVVFAGGFYIYKTESFKPQYTSQTTFLVSTRDGSFDAYSNLTTTTQLNSVFKMILDSNALAEAVKDDLGIANLDASITASIVPETNLMVLKVTASSPKESYDILNSVIKCYPAFSDEVMGDAVLDVFDASSVPTHADNSSGALKWAVLGFLVGAFLCFALIVVLSYLKDTVKTEHQLEKKIDTKLYATIPHEKKRKRKGIMITDVTCSFNYEEAYNKLRSKIEREARNKGYKAFVIASSLENEGKTTVAANLAAVLARKEHKVLLVDLDLRNPAITKIIEADVPKDKDISKYFTATGSKNVKDYIVKSEKIGVDILMSQHSVANISRAFRRSSLSSAIKALKNDYDFIIIDTPPIALVSDVDDIALAGDASLIVVREDEARSIVINDAIDALTRTATPLLGAIFNDSKSSSSSGYGYAYYGGYSKYGYGGYGKYGKYGKYKQARQK